MTKQATSHEALVKNLRALMRATSLSAPTLAKKSGVSLRMINSILSFQRTPTIMTVDKLAGAFHLSGWQIITPGLPEDMEQSRQLATTVINFLRSGMDGRQYISHVAEKEATYK